MPPETPAEKAPAAGKPKVAFYWCASCGGCEEAVVDLNEDILKVADAVDIILWPVALDYKKKDIEALADGEIVVSFINGAIRLEDQAEWSRLLRRKSQVVIAFGSCAHMGGIPALANFKSRQGILDRVYLEVPTMENPDKVFPMTQVEFNGHSMKLPEFWDEVKRLDEVVDVDYFLPGCPPMPDTIMDAVGAILEGKLPPKGAVLSPSKTLCQDCPRSSTRPETVEIKEFKRIWQVEVPTEDCFLAHGLVCMGPATRSGCSSMCINANMPCRGCYGPSDGVEDQGAAIIGALGSMIAPKDAGKSAGIFATLDDPAGTFYRFSLSASLAHKGGLLKKKGGQPR